MKGRSEIWLLTLAVFGLMFTAFTKVLTESFDVVGLIQIAACVLPLLILILFAASRVWLGLGLGSVGLIFSIPFALVNRIEVGMWLVLLLLALSVAGAIMKPGAPSLFRGTPPRLMLIVLAVVIGRLLYDRPGSANTGDLGGAGEAFYFLVGCLAFFVMSGLGASEWETRPNLRVLTWVLLLALMVQYAFHFYQGLLTVVLSLFSRQAWFLCPLALAAAFEARRRSPDGFGMTRVLAVIGVVLIISVLSPHRSRPLFALGSILCVAWVYGSMRKIIFWVTIPFAVLFLAAFWTEGRGVPYLASRSLSIIIPVSTENVEGYIREFGASDETGWDSSFRKQLWTLAATGIKKNPFLGKGFAYSRDEVMWAYSRSGAVEDAVQGLAVSGCYHNSLLELAVFCGLPAAAIFVTVFILVIWRVTRDVPLVADPAMRIMLAGAMGFLVATTGQFLMNGSGRDFFYVCVILGALWGLHERLSRQVVPAAGGSLAQAGNAA